jgi:hypothetical protein
MQIKLKPGDLFHCERDLVGKGLWPTLMIEKSFYTFVKHTERDSSFPIASYLFFSYGCISSHNGKHYFSEMQNIGAAVFDSWVKIGIFKKLK